MPIREYSDYNLSKVYINGECIDGIKGVEISTLPLLNSIERYEYRRNMRKAISKNSKK